MSGYMKDKLAALTAPMANAYANDVVFNKIENLVATFRHRKSTKTSSRFLPVNTKGNDKSYQNSGGVGNLMAVAVDNPMETEPIARETLPPMVKLAMFCATKGEGSTNPKERPKEMSSEGSSTEGGC
ncbi:hypothetical protein YC2023_072484 [Brassica napus]